MKHKALILTILSITFFLFATDAFAQYNYTPMEKIPGTTENISAFPDYIKAIYKFALWSVGIAALLMVSVGGFMYFSAAGNTSKLDKAKIVIRDSIFGITAVLTAYLLLYTINPDLVGVSLSGLSNLGNSANASVSFQSASPSQGTANYPFQTSITITGNGSYTLESLTISGMDSSNYTSSLSNNTITVVVHNPPMGTHQITATILDQDNNSHTSENLNFKIISDLSQLAITTLGLNEGIAEENYSNQTITVEGGIKPYAITVQNLPSGLTFDSSSNSITGTPTQAGSYLVLISATDSANSNIEKTLSLNIREGTYAGNGGNNNQSNSAELSRNPLSISVTEGGNVSDKTILVTDNLGNSLAFQIVGVNGDWISSPKAGDTGNRTLNVSFGTTALSTGNHNGSVTLKPDGFNNLTLNILLTVWGSGEGGGGSGGGNLPECRCGVNILPGYDNYCQVCKPCHNNQGYCNDDSECEPGLICNKYNICAYSDHGMPGDCSYNFPNGHPEHCATCGPCVNGEGLCFGNSQCKSDYCDLEFHTCQAGPHEECSGGGWGGPNCDNYNLGQECEKDSDCHCPPGKHVSGCICACGDRDGENVRPSCSHPVCLGTSWSNYNEYFYGWGYHFCGNGLEPGDHNYCRNCGYCDECIGGCHGSNECADGLYCIEHICQKL